MQHELINLTPHPVRIYDSGGTSIALNLPSHGSLRTEEKIVRTEQLDSYDLKLEVVDTLFGDLYLDTNEQTPAGVQLLEGNLPCVPGRVYIVSVFAGGHPSLRGRSDVVQPDTGPESVVRDEDGRLSGVRRFRRLCGNAE